MVGDSSSGSDRENAHFFLATRNTIKGVRGKEQRRNEQKGLGQIKCKKVKLRHCIPCRLKLACIPAKILETTGSPDSSWLVFPHCCWTLSYANSSLLLPGVNCPLPFCVCLRQLLPLGSFVQLLLAFLCLLPVASISQVQTLCLVSCQNRQRDRQLHSVTELPFSVEIYSFWLKCIYSFFSLFPWKSMSSAVCSGLCSWDSARLGLFVRSAMSFVT